MTLKTLRFTASAIALAAITLTGCNSVQQGVAPNTLVAAKVARAPNVNALASDPAWAAARPLAIDLTDGANFGGTGKTDAVLKAVYSGDMLYMMVQYKDPTNSTRRGPYQKQADGSWKKLVAPTNKGGDETLYYEDKWAVIWPTGSLVKGFEEQGCAVLCHEGQGKPFGNKYTPAEGQIADMWHMKGSRTGPMGWLDDQYVDHTRYVAGVSNNAGRKPDPGTTTGEYNGFNLVDGKPQFMQREGRAANAGGTYYIKRGEEVPFKDTFKAGDEVASYIVNPLVGDRADVRVTTKWENGMHTAVLSRKLVTGSKFDVQFSSLDSRYPFGFAAFDNAQVRHATNDDTLYLTFGK